MGNRKLNKKGFTLIELLAVIVILAILMTLAITSMSGVITKAKKDTFVTTALQYSNSIRFKIINGELEAPGTGGCTVVSTKKVELEGGQYKSSFDKKFLDGTGPATEKKYSYVVIYNSGDATTDAYEYYIQMVDEQNNGFVLKNENSLSRDDVKVKAINLTGTGENVATAMPAQGGTLSGVGTAGSCTVEHVYE